MKRFIALLCLIVFLATSAQNKIDYGGRILLDNPNQTYNAIVEFDKEGADFGDCKVDVISHLGNMVVVNVTVSQISAIAELPHVVRVSVGAEQMPLEKSSLQDSSITNQNLLNIDSHQLPQSVQLKESNHGHKSFIAVLWQKIKSIF